MKGMGRVVDTVWSFVDHLELTYMSFTSNFPFPFVLSPFDLSFAQKKKKKNACFTLIPYIIILMIACLAVVQSHGQSASGTVVNKATHCKFIVQHNHACTHLCLFLRKQNQKCSMEWLSLHIKNGQFFRFPLPLHKAIENASFFLASFSVTF